MRSNVCPPLIRNVCYYFREAECNGINKRHFCPRNRFTDRRSHFGRDSMPVQHPADDGVMLEVEDLKKLV